MSVPGENIRKRRVKEKLSMRQLASMCSPTLDHTTVRRVEMNEGYTQDTLEKIAQVLKCKVEDFFLPQGLEGWSVLPEQDQEYIIRSVRNAEIAQKYSRDQQSEETST